MSKAGARNPKVAQFSIRLNDEINARLEAVSDNAGQNKGTMAAMAVAAGLNLLEQIYGSNLRDVADRVAAQEASNLAQRATNDMEAAAAVQRPQNDDRKFRMHEPQRPEPQRPEWSGYMPGL